MASEFLPLYFGDVFVGDLVREASGDIRFEARVDAAALFPKKSEEMKTFLENLLPEGARENWYYAMRRMSSPDLFGWLRDYGGDNVGFVRTPTGKGRKPRDITKEVRELIARRQPLDAVLPGQKSLLPGADLKMAVIYQNGRFLMPNDNHLSTHILKYGNELCLNEAFCLALMDRTGISAAVHGLLEIGGQEALLSKRFDRKDGKAIDQRDFCQELKILSRLKYSVTHRQIADLLANLIPLDRESFVSMQLFNIIMGAHDDHGKNFSILRENGYARLAPAYDVASISVARKVSPVYRKLFNRLSRPIGGQTDPERLKAAHFKILADIYGMDYGFMAQKLHGIASSISELHITLLEEFKCRSEKLDLDRQNRDLHRKTLETFARFIPLQTERFRRIADYMVSDCKSRKKDAVRSVQAGKPEHNLPFGVY